MRDEIERIADDLDGLLSVSGEWTLFGTDVGTMIVASI